MMRSLVLALALASASAFAPAPAARVSTQLGARSQAMPFLEQPAKLDGSMAGDVGFDPLGLSNIEDVGLDLYWMREAEIKHGRIAMMAVAGVIWVEVLGSFPGMPEGFGKCQMDVFWDVWAEKPNFICAALAFITVIEAISGIATTKGRETGTRDPGDFNLNPMKFEVTEDLKMKEVANGRLAMWAAAGEIIQGISTHDSAFGNLLHGAVPV